MEHTAENDALARVEEVLDMYESCGPKQQSTRDVLAAIREAIADPMSDGCRGPGCTACGEEAGW